MDDEGIFTDDDIEFEEQGDDEGWIMSYADLMSLLTVFFMLFFTTNNYFVKETEKKEVQELVKEYTDKFKKYKSVNDQKKSLKDFVDKLPPEQPMIALKEVVDKILTTESETKDDEIFNQIISQIEKSINLEGILNLVKEKDHLKLVFQEDRSFKSGSVQLNEGVISSLKLLMENIVNVKDSIYIRVEGHTDSMKISRSLKKQFPSNWELSAARGISVLKALENSGFSSKQMSVVAHANNNPLVKEKDNVGFLIPEAASKNSRVEVKIFKRERLYSDKN